VSGNVARQLIQKTRHSQVRLHQFLDEVHLVEVAIVIRDDDIEDGNDVLVAAV
jgi:hypothetical protein